MIALKKSFLTLALAGMLALGGTALLAQEDGGTDVNPEELIASAKAALGEKKYGKALQDLNLAVATIGKLRVEQLKKTFPDAPAGWTAQDAEGNSQAQMFGVGLVVKRAYHKDQSELDIELTADSPMIGMMAAMFSNPALVQGQEGMSIVTIKGKRGIMEFHKDATSGKISFLLNNNTALIVVNGNGVKKADVTEMAKAIDLDKMEKALQN